jgi:hypothetical protein
VEQETVLHPLALPKVDLTQASNKWGHTVVSLVQTMDIMDLALLTGQLPVVLPVHTGGQITFLAVIQAIREVNSMPAAGTILVHLHRNSNNSSKEWCHRVEKALHLKVHQGPQRHRGIRVPLPNNQDQDSVPHGLSSTLK